VKVMETQESPRKPQDVRIIECFLESLCLGAASLQQEWDADPVQDPAWMVRMRDSVRYV
ncbi:hypothetical protein ElyMa_000300000, partial [Elysia marginata]